MGLLSKFGLKNRDAPHYQKNYEEKGKQALDVNNEQNIKIDIGSRGQVNASKEARSTYYKKVKDKITQRDLETIRDISKSSRTINDVFRKMEHTDLPLEYLVALGRVEEVDIEAYQNLKVKGLDLKNTLETSELEGIDETLKMQVFSQAKELPKLKQTTIIPEEDPTPIDPSIFRKEYEDQQEEEIETEQEEEIVDIEDDPIKEERSIDKLKSLAEIIKNKKRANQEKQVEEAVEEVKVKQPSTRRILKRRIEDRTVYVIADRIPMPVFKGYNVIKVETMKEINQFTSSKRDLLVISQNIPAAIQNKLLSWLKGVAESDTKYRIVTLKGLEVTHDLIETKISLNMDSINKYYEEFPDKNYGGKDVGSFRDINQFLN